jgi:hypothetical protein
MASSLGDIPTTPVRRLMGLVECSLARCAAGKPGKSAAQTPNGFRYVFHRPATSPSEAKTGLRRAVFPASRALPYQHGGICRRPDGCRRAGARRPRQPAIIPSRRPPVQKEATRTVARCLGRTPILGFQSARKGSDTASIPRGTRGRDRRFLCPRQDCDPCRRFVTALPPWPDQAGARDSILGLLGQ